MSRLRTQTQEGPGQRGSRVDGTWLKAPSCREQFLWSRHRGIIRVVRPNPSIERTCQGPLRAPCPAAHVER